MKIIQNNKEINYQLQLTKSRSSLISGVKSLNTFSFATATAQLVPSSTDATKCLQFGPQAKTSGELSTIKVTVPAGEVWIVKISASVPRMRVDSSAERNTWVAIVEEITDRSTTGAKWLSTMTSNHTYTDGGSFFAVRTLSAGTYYYGLAGWSEEAASTSWTAGASEYRTTVPTNADGIAGPSYTLTAELLQKSGESLDSSPNGFDPYNVSLGTVLCVLEDTQNLTGSFPSSTSGSYPILTGTFTKYGPMSDYYDPPVVKITTPSNETWTVEVSYSAKCQIQLSGAEAYMGAGVGVSTTAAIPTRIVPIVQSLYSRRGSDFASPEYDTVSGSKMVVIPANTTIYFVGTVITGSSTTSGAYTLQAAAGSYNYGPAYSMKITLVNKSSS